MSERTHMSEHDARVDRLLRRPKFERFHKGPEISVKSGEPQTWNNPLDELIAREEAALCEAAVDSLEACQEMLKLDVLPEPLRELIAAASFDAFRQYEETLMGWLFDDSPHPLAVLRKLYLYARKKNARLIWNMSYRDLGELFGVSYETLRIEAKNHFGDLPGGATKTPSARAKMKAAAMGNTCRKGGKKAQVAA